MGKGHTARATTTRLDLGDGDWLDVKDELSVGDAQAIDQSKAGGDVAVAVATAVAWIHDWSMCDATDKRMKVSEASVRALSTRMFGRITDALLPHVQKAREVPGNAPSDPTGSDQPSPSAG